MVAQYGERPHEGPAFGMQLGGGHIYLSQERPLEHRERQAESNSLKDGGV